jgi:BASS family bile acid:Na+ symporter
MQAKGVWRSAGGAYNSPMAETPMNTPNPQPSTIQKFWRLYGRTLALILAMAAGALVPQAQAASEILPYLLMAMLFFSFLDITITRESFHFSMLLIFIANLAIPLAIFFIFRPIDPVVALVGFLTAIAPTATATPVIVSYLRGRVDYVLPCVLITNIGIALVLPFLLPWIAGSTVHITTGEILPPVLEVMFVPLGLAFFIREFLPRVQRFLLPGKMLSFPIWLAMLFIVTSRASAFLESTAGFSMNQLLWIAFISLIICVVNFGAGAVIGGRDFRREGSQALGQKNNSFTVWIALTYLNPLAALGPTFYVLYHNLYNGLQLYMAERDATLKPEKSNTSGSS